MTDGVELGVDTGALSAAERADWAALAADRPVILEAYTDPNVPPLPPHITLKDAKNFLSMIHSEPELGSVLKNSAKELLTSVLPGKE